MLLQGLDFSLQGKPTTSDLFVCSPSVNELAGSIYVLLYYIVALVGLVL